MPDTCSPAHGAVRHALEAASARAAKAAAEAPAPAAAAATTAAGAEDRYVRYSDGPMQSRFTPQPSIWALLEGSLITTWKVHGVSEQEYKTST